MQGSYYFKLARTTNTQTYPSPVDIQVSEFFNNMKANIIRDFGFANENEFVIIRCGQDIPGIRYAEDAPPIHIENLIGTVYDNYQMHDAFYISRVSLNEVTSTLNQPTAIFEEPTVLSIRSENAASLTRNNQIESTQIPYPGPPTPLRRNLPPSSHPGILPYCNICSTSEYLRMYYNCMHLHCNLCFNHCIIACNNKCSICRADPIA